MSYFKVGNREYDVLVVGVSESFTILYSNNTGRSIAPGARMILDPLGTFYGHKVTVRRKEGKEAEYDALFMYVSKPRYDGIWVEIVHNQTILRYEAYVSQGERRLKRVDINTGKVYWEELELNIIPMKRRCCLND